VHVRVVRHGRAPRVEHGREPDPGAEVLRIGRDGEQRVGGRAELSTPV